MFINTHKLIAKSIIDNIDEDKNFFIDENNFIYGNIKPDLPSKYFFQKHYMKESYDMIIHKVNSLCSLNLNCLSKYFSVGSLSQELGIICHFLCDFLCVPHSNRWEFKHSMKKHISYETELNSIAKETNLKQFKGENISYNCFEDFFKNIYNEYQKTLNHKNDLFFSTYVCNSVINYILDAILKNSAKSYSISKAVI